MKSLALLLLCAFAAEPGGFKPRHGWHRATQSECNAEAHRESMLLGKAGIVGDQPITNGFSEFTSMGYAEVSTLFKGKAMNPCGWTNGKEFRARFVIYNGQEEKEVSEREYEAFRF